MSDDALAAIHGNRDRPNPANGERLRVEEEGEDAEEHNKRLSADENERARRTLMKILQNNDAKSSTNDVIAAEEDMGVGKEDVPELLSADDLKRLAANQPKSMEPPVLLKVGENRRTVLDETIEKLKKRVVTSDPNFPRCDVVSENTRTESLNELHEESIVEGHQINNLSELAACSKESAGNNGLIHGFTDVSEESVFADEKEQDAADDDKHSEQSESSMLSRYYSSSISQSISSRSNSPAVDESNRLTKNSGKVQGDEKDSQEGNNLRYTFDTCNSTQILRNEKFSPLSHPQTKNGSKYC